MQEMTDAEIGRAIDQARIGILGLADGGRAYAIPIGFAYEDGVFYWRSHPGYKEAYLHDTEEACLTMVHGFDLDDGDSVMAFGDPEPIWDEAEIEEAEDALEDVAPPPELGTDEEGQPKRSGKHAVHWKLEPDRLTGRKSEPA
jgi:nitroimidazol reductase NimA-like FMN-containing flavoprotein (pyridoxamine 5'-phosphate oxidase superfamily)